MLGITVFGRRIHEQRTCATLPVELGSRPPDPSAATNWKVDVDDFANRQCEVLESPFDGQVTIVNYGRSIQIGDGVRLFPGQRHNVQLPVVLWVGETIVRLFEIEESQCELLEAEEGFVALEGSLSDEGTSLVPPKSNRAPGVPTLSAWFECLTQLQQQSSIDTGFFRNAAKAIFDPGGFDAGMLLLRADDQWQVAASYVPNPGHAVSFRTDLLELVGQTGETRFHCGENPASTPSLISTAIAPILDATREIVGAVYGTRIRNPRNNRSGIRPIEAHFLRLVAQTLSASMIRSRKETEIAESHSLLRQVFPDKVVECLRNDPQILDGRESVVTTLFVDLRGFSALVNRLPPRTTWQLVTDLMDCWTGIVIECGGAIVDYYGDGLAAFWNAPVECSNHASLAVECAFRLRKSLPELNDKWSSVAGAPLEIGIGIATGVAQVGNCGSRQRIKYGPHGSCVNLARRLESLTTTTGIPILVSAETAAQICDDYLMRRLFQANIKGFAGPQSVWQPIEFDHESPVAAMTEYEIAMGLLESGDRAGAIRKLQSLQVDLPSDTAVRFILHWIENNGSAVIDGNTTGKDSPANVSSCIRTDWM